MPILYIMCGPSGCGKSTWAHNFIIENDRNKNDIRYVSRDNIRLELLKDGEDYFSHEKAVFRRFVGYIYNTLIDGFDVIADATHLNEFSRRKLTQAIDMHFQDYEIVYVVFNTDVNTCVARNENRKGRRYVPENVIRNMCRDFQTPTKDEDDRIINIIEVGE
jgi:predicted kinase